MVNNWSTLVNILTGQGFQAFDQWVAFCDRFPGLRWFVIDGVVLFPIPLVEQLKAENPGILSEDVYNKDYSRNFAEKHVRVPLGCSLKENTPEIPPWVKSITEREGTKEAYQLKGYEDDPNAVGFVFEGGPSPKHYGKASYEAHQQIGAVTIGHDSRHCDRGDDRAITRAIT